MLTCVSPPLPTPSLTKGHAVDMDLVWIDDQSCAKGPAAAGWLLARGLAQRGHRVSWLVRDDRSAPQWVDGVRLCSFPYDEREWPPGDGLYWGSVRLLGREIPADAVITAGGPDAPVMVHEALRHRKMRVRELWWPTWHPSTVTLPVAALMSQCSPGIPGTVSVPVPVPSPPVSRPAARTAEVLRIAVGAFGSPPDGVDVALPGLATAAARCPGEISVRFLTIGGRDAAWKSAAVARSVLPNCEAISLWSPGFDEQRLWHVLAEADYYVSLARGFDLVAGAAALAGVPVLRPRGDTCAGGPTFQNSSELTEILTDRRSVRAPDTAHLRGFHAGPALLDTWEALLR